MICERAINCEYSGPHTLRKVWQETLHNQPSFHFLMAIQKSDFFLPKRKDLPLLKSDVDKWYTNLLHEISRAEYSPNDLVLLQDKHNYYGKYFSENSRKFFLSHFGHNLTETVNYFFRVNQTNQRFLEIGCGCGNQLLLTAFLGAEVVGCDIRKDVCDLVQRRKEFYEKKSGRKLNISISCEDVFKVDWGKWGKFDAINFLFSFNDLKPNKKIFELLDILLKPGGRVVLQETNPSNYYNKIFRNRASMTPLQVVEALKRHGFRVHSLRGGYALPPIFWRFLPRSILIPIDQLLCRSLFMAPSYHLMAEKM